MPVTTRRGGTVVPDVRGAWGAQVSIEELSQEFEAKWDTFLARHAAARHCMTTPWRRIVASVFGHETPYLLARTKGLVVGVLPLTRIRSRLFGNYMVSLPYVNYGGALAESPVVAQSLMIAAGELALRAGCSHVEFRDCVAIDGWPARTDKVVMELDLPDSYDVLLKSVGAKIRAQIRRPVREGATALVGTTDLLDDFYAVFSRNMRDLGTPVYPKRFFAAVLDTFPEHARVHVVRVTGRPVAAAIVIGYGTRIEIPWASSLREYNRLGVNMMLYGEVLRYAIEEGYLVFDFGRSSIGGGTFRFKAQWGAQPRQLYWHYWLRSGQEIPGLTPDNPKFRFAISVWRRLPVAVTNFIGPHVVRGLP